VGSDRNLQNELHNLTGWAITRLSTSGIARRREIRQDADFHAALFAYPANVAGRKRLQGAWIGKATPVYSGNRVGVDRLRCWQDCHKDQQLLAV
jgi:hypothetical protein